MHNSCILAYFMPTYPDDKMQNAKRGMLNANA
jgi:hypothetical protein